MLILLKDSVSILQILVSVAPLICWFSYFRTNDWDIFVLAYVATIFSALFSIWIINKKDRRIMDGK